MHHPFESSDRDWALDGGAALLRQAKEVAVLSGAGVSAESGLATFRGGGGLWEGHRVEEVATPRGFQRDPRLVWRFYNARRAAGAQAAPNPAHFALAALEDHLGSDHFTLATQNVDGLHQAAGSRHVLELHGSLTRVRCTKCGVFEDRGNEPLPELPQCSRCGGLLRPDIVWFHESLPESVWQEAERAASKCQCYLAVGTSAMVYPAAGLIDVARKHGARIIEVNLERTGIVRAKDIGLYGPAGQILPELVQRAGCGPN
jgi:NAD-dependent deacetylase